MAKGWRSVLEKVVKAGAAKRSALERIFKVTLDISGNDVLCATCRKGGKKIRGEGASGLCRVHNYASKMKKRSKERH
jgi:hypothetical protein